MALIDLPRVDFMQEGLTDQEKLDRMAKYLFKLDERLRYMLAHIDEENMTDAMREKLEG